MKKYENAYWYIEAVSEKIEPTITHLKTLKELIPNKEELKNKIIENLNKELCDGFLWVYKYNSFMNKHNKIHIYLGKAQMNKTQLFAFYWSHNEMSWEKHLATKDLSLETWTMIIDYFKE